MELCRECFVLLLSLQYVALVYPTGLMNGPIVFDSTHLFDMGSPGVWDASNLIGDTPDRLKFDQEVTLGEDGDVKLSWNFSEENITFKLSARTFGWIGFGIARNQVGKAGSDFAIFGYKDEYNYNSDMHIDKNEDYVVDTEQDVEATFIWETFDETYAIFTRPLITCDQKEDVDVTSDTLRIIWAYGAADIQGYTPKKGELYSAKSGSLNIKLLNPTIPALDANTPGTDIETLDIKLENVKVEQGEYHHCTAFRFPRTRMTKSQIVQFEPLVTQGNEYNVRQITVQQCAGSVQGLHSSYRTDVDCVDPNTISSCKTIVLKWSIGMSTFTFPSQVGYPIGEPATYFIMEIKYANPHIPALFDSSGLRIYYTSKPRQFEAGVMSTGSLVHESQIIPPRSPSFLLQGHCMKECIRMALPEDGNVTIFAALLHARETGRKIRLRHFRDGEELVPIAEDNQFHFFHQETQFLKDEIQLRKGDNMIVECTYDTFDRNEITYVNNSKGGESCLAYLSYYPRIAKLTACETAPTESVIMATVGAVRPEEMRKSAEQFEWTSQQTKEYNNRLLESQVYVHCGDIQLKEPQPVPAIKKLYVKHHRCKGHDAHSDDGGNGSISTTSATNSVNFVFLMCSSLWIILNLHST